MPPASTEKNSPPKRKNTDVQCLRCGAWNIPENHICGACGANLPLVYDEEGKVRNFAWSGDRTGKPRLRDPVGRSYRIGWAVRFGILILAFLIAFFLRHGIGH